MNGEFAPDDEWEYDIHPLPHQPQLAGRGWVLWAPIRAVTTGAVAYGVFVRRRRIENPPAVVFGGGQGAGGGVQWGAGVASSGSGGGGRR